MTDKEELVKIFNDFNEHIKKIESHCKLLQTEIEQSKDQFTQEDNARINCSVAYSTHALLWSMFPSA